MSSAGRDHYSYTHYAEPDTARTFDERRFGGPIGEIVAATQARVVTNFVGRIHERTILDVGTGTGRAALLFARGGAKVVGIDASEEMLAVARQRALSDGTPVTFQTGDAHALPFPDRSFEVVVSLRVLMHTPDWRTCIAEMCRVSDRLIVLDYPSSRSMALIQSLARRIAHALGRPTEPYRVFSDAEIAAAIKQGGFRVTSRHRLFVLPIALHKAIGSRKFTVKVESLLERSPLRVFGSPVTLVAERCVIS